MIRTLDLSKLVVFDGYYASGPYERFERLVVDPVTLPFHGTDLAVGGALRTLSGTYSLVVDGVVQAKSTPIGARGSFARPPMTPGWHQLDIACPPGESCPTWFVFAGSGPATQMPVFDGSYGITHPIASGSAAGPVAVQHWQMVPTNSEPTPRPLPARAHPPFATAVPPSQLYRRELVTVTQGDVHRANTSKAGIVSTMNQQAYFWASFIAKYPLQSLLDGRRGVGTVHMATHLEPGGTKGGTWFCDPWRFGHINADGKIQTMIGYRDDYPPRHWEDGTVPALLGDWSALAVKGFHELWGMAWRKSTLALDMNAPPINGEQPHIVGPQAFFADSQNNRVLRATWSPTDRSVPPVMTLFASGKDAWDVVEAGEKVYISFRGEHRIAEHDAATGAFIRDVVKGAALASVAANRLVTRLAPLAAIQAEPCVAPEGLFVQDGVLGFGSYAMAQVRQVDLTTGANTVACLPTIDGNSKFVKVARSDNTAGPRGTWFVSTWSNNYFGHPQAFTPDGKPWNWFNAGPFACGKGGRWDVLGYSTSCGAALGRLVCGSSAEGVTEYSLALATDAAKDEAKYVAGRAQWWAKGYALVHGELGFGPFGLPLPYGDTPEMDYFLNWNSFASEGATALPPPPPPTGAGMFTSVTLKSQTGNYTDPKPIPSNQPYIFHGHGSSGGGSWANPTGYGTWYEAVRDASMGGNEAPIFKFYVYNSGGYSGAPQIQVGPIDLVLRNGVGMETLWFGWIPPGQTDVQPYTWQTLDAIDDWTHSNHPQASLTKCSYDGNSMGGWCAAQWALFTRRANGSPRFAAVWGLQSRWRAAETVNWGTGQRVIAPNANVVGYGKTLSQMHDVVTRVGDTSIPLPFFLGTINTNDEFSPWTDYKAGIAAMRARNRSPLITNATRNGYAFAWEPGIHGASAGPYPGALIVALSSAYDQRNFELGVGYPCFDNSSRDDDPEATPSGRRFINAGFKWRNVVESAGAWSCEVSNTLGATTVDALPRSDIFAATVAAQTVTIPAGTWVPVTFAAGSQPLQPTITNFVATPGTVAAGQSAVLTATLANAVSQTIDGAAWDGQPLTVTPAASHTYTLVATGAAGTTPATAMAGVVVTANAPTLQSLDARMTAVEGRLAAAGIA